MVFVLYENEANKKAAPGGVAFGFIAVMRWWLSGRAQDWKPDLDVSCAFVPHEDVVLSGGIRNRRGLEPFVQAGDLSANRPPGEGYGDYAILSPRLADHTELLAHLVHPPSVNPLH